MAIRALIFDFDGLILETETPALLGWQKVFEEYGGRMTFEQWMFNIGNTHDPIDPAQELERQTGKKLDRQELLDKRRKYQIEYLIGQPPLPGVEEYLKDARQMGLKLGLASSSGCAWVSGNLIRLELIDYFDSIRTADEVQRVKPNPDLYLAVMTDLDIQPEQAIAFEDSPYGILAAQQAGLFVVAVPNSLTLLLDLPPTDIVLNSMSDVPLAELIKRIENGRFQDKLK